MYTFLEETPVYTLGCPLSPFFRILVYFLLPPLLSCIIYLTLIVADISLVYYHIAEENPRWGAITLSLMFIPSITGSIFILSSRDRWPTDKSKFKFVFLNLWYIFGFPFAAMYRYLHQIYWSMEALCAHCVSHVERTENALRILLKPNSMELYFFLQSFMHSTPQILLQFHIIFTYSYVNHDLFSIQILSIMMSLMRMATTTMSYQRFERRKILGVHYPWISKENLRKSRRYSNTTTIKSGMSDMPPPYSHSPEITTEQPTSIIDQVQTKPVTSEDEDEVFEEPKKFDADIYEEPRKFEEDHYEKPRKFDEDIYEEPRKFEEDIYKDPSYNVDNGLPDVVMRRNEATSGNKVSSSSTIYEEPISFYDHSKIKRVVSIVEDPEIEKKRMSRVESQKKTYVIEDMSKHVTPPLTPAPRPTSLAFIKDKIVTNAEHFVDMIPQRRHREELHLPVRIRRQVIKGVEQEDGVAKMIAFIAWFLFIGARILVLTSFSSFYLMGCVYICLSHYILVTALLLCNSWSEKWRRKVFYLFLGYVYTFCLIEFKMKFKRVRLWYGVFFSLIFIENFILTAVWYWTGIFNNWWYHYIILMIIGTTVMSFVCFTIYALLLKPKRVTKYPAVSLFSVSPVSPVSI